MRPMDAALSYAARGWCVFPCFEIILPSLKCSCRKQCGRDAGKHPRIAKWQENASSDPQQIMDWWRKWPDANVAVLTGEKSGIFVFDIDPDKGGIDSYKSLIQLHGELPPTKVVNTGGGGLHFYFSWPTDGKLIQNRSDIAPGLDVRGDRGYVIAPPSNHLSGRCYVDRTQIN